MINAIQTALNEPGVTLALSCFLLLFIISNCHTNKLFISNDYFPYTKFEKIYYRKMHKQTKIRGN